MIRKSLICLMLVSLAGVAKAQYIPAHRPDSLDKTIADVVYWHKGNTFKHLEVSLTAGTSGIGLDIAAPVSQYVQIRLGYDYMPRIGKTFRFDVLGGAQSPVAYDKVGNRVATNFDHISDYYYQQTKRDLVNHVDLRGKMMMQNAKLMVDIYPWKYFKAVHFTVGVYYGPSEFLRMEQTKESEAMLKDILAYNQMYQAAASNDKIKGYGQLSIGMGHYSHNFQQGDARRLMNAPYEMLPTAEGTVTISSTSNQIKPYIGAGYGGRLIAKRNDWKVTGELGVMIWGGTPSQTVHDGTNLSKDVKDYPTSLMKVVKALKVYPVLSVRFSKTLF